MRPRPNQLQRISRRGLISSGVLAGVLAATGVQVQAKARGGVLRLAAWGEAAGWQPGRDPGPVMQVAGQGAVYETLTEITATGELTGELAESWEPGDGGAIWTVNLRRGVLFHDGRALTASDVVASFEVHRGPSPASGIVGLVRGMRALNSHQVRFELHRPDANFPLYLADPHLVVGPGGVFDGTGSGPYRVAEFVAGQRLLLSRVEAHRLDGRGAWFDAIVLRVMDDARARTAALLAGHVDAVDAPADVDMIAARRGFHVVRAQANGLSFTVGAEEAARLAGLPLQPGAPDLPMAHVHPAYAWAGLTGGRYGLWAETLFPRETGADAPITAHMPFTIAFSDRLRHDPVGELHPLDSGRIAKRWWFA